MKRAFALILLTFFISACGAAPPVTLSPTLEPPPLATPLPESPVPITTLETPPLAPTSQPADALPVDSEWHVNRQEWGTCGHTLEAHDPTGGVVPFGTELFGYIERPHAPPLLIGCANSARDLFVLKSLQGTRVRLDLPQDRQIIAFSFVLSPDEKELAFATVPYPNVTQGDWQIWAAQLQSGTTRQLLTLPTISDGGQETPWDSARPLAWRSDGLFFSTQASGTHAVWQALGQTAETSKLFTIQLGDDAVMDFAISKTTTWIAYRKGLVQSSRPSELRLLNTATGEDRLIEQGRGYDTFAFTEDAEELLYRRTSQPQSAYADSSAVAYEELVRYHIADGTMRVEQGNTLNPRLQFSASNAQFYGSTSTIIYKPN